MAHSKTMKFGRTARKVNPRVPHMSALLAGQPPLKIPDTTDYTEGMPNDLGMMLNDNLGDCTCAAFYHARQIWTYNASKQEITEPDSDVEQLYIEACAYNPQEPGEGPGGNEQDVLTFLLNTGAPIGTSGQQRDKILAFLEVDPRNSDDMKRTIFECGISYIGFPVPSNVTYDNPVWDLDPKAQMTDEGHAVILAGYDAKGAIVVSWGRRYTMTWAFVSQVVDEAYAIADNSWVSATGKTPAGLSITELQDQMQALTNPQPALRGS